MARQRGEFRKAAAEARARLSGGFWEEENAKRDEFLNEAQTKGVCETQARDFYRNQLSVALGGSTTGSEEEELYAKVVKILRFDPNANPLSHVLDRDYMRTLDDRDRDRYVFNLSAKVQECVVRYNREKDML